MSSKLAARADATYAQALALQKQGRIDDAAVLCRKVLQVQPRHFDTLNLYGLIALQKSDVNGGIELLKRATAANPRNAIARGNLGNAQFLLKDYAAAIANYDGAIALSPDFADAYYNRGTALRSLGKNEEAIASFDKAIALNPSYVEAFSNRGNALRDLGRHAQSIESYDAAIAVNPQYPEAYNNRGTSLRDLRRLEEAVASYDKAIALRPDYAEAFNNRGNAHRDLRHFDAAGADYDKAIELRPDYADAYMGRATLLFDLKRYVAALSNYQKVIELKCFAPGLYGQCWQIKMFVCDWSSMDQELEEIRQRTERGEPASNPFCLMARTDLPALHKRAAEVWISKEHPEKAILPALPKYPAHERIKIGYFSADFYNHATMQLMARLFELHDRSKFELIAFSFGPDLRDAMRERLDAAGVRVIDVRLMTDQETAALARELQIDIAVDLKGFTQDCRPNIFAMRAAPIQVNYLGYPGTMGAPYIDYLIADRTLIPEQSRQFYTEKIVYLPNSYQVNDSNRKVSDKNFTREELGLPTEGTVYCCFNNTYKITPDVFDAWMRILGAVQGSALWLLEDNSAAADNMRNRATQSRIDPRRLVFAKRAETSEHLARQRMADLFLDTLPYNAHTTTSDALWVGLPVLTCIGESFAARVAASLLNAVGLSELITATLQDYETLAISLGSHPEQLAALKSKLAANRLSSSLFDSALYTKHIEAAFSLMYARYQAGEAPEHLHIEP